MEHIKTTTEIINDYKKELKNMLKTHNEQTLTCFDLLDKKLDEDETHFNHNDQFVFNTLNKQEDFNKIVKQPKSKYYLAKKTNLVEPVKNDTDSVLFKFNKVNYKLCDFDSNQVDHGLLSDVNHLQNETNVNNFYFFKQLCNQILETNPNLIHLDFETDDLNFVLRSKMDELEQNLAKESFIHGYLSGGAMGGNCWNNNLEYFQESPPSDYNSTEFPQVTELLKQLDPDISFLKYKGIEDDIKKSVVQKQITVPEYYGNHSNYEIAGIDFKLVYHSFENNGVNLDLNNIKNNLMNSKTKKQSKKPKMTV